MDIVCPECKTEYEFDERHITSSGVSVQCTNCGYTFKVRRREVVEIEAASAEPDGAQADSSPWVIRSAAGEMRRFRELATLQQWIIDRRVAETDEISRSGDKWKPLSQISELASFFQAARAQAESDRERGALPNPTGAEDLTDDGPVTLGSLDDSLADEPAFARESADFAPVARSAAWERSSVRVSTSGPHAPIEDELPRRGSGKWLGLAVLSVLLVGAGGLFALEPEVLGDFFRGLFKNAAPSDADYAKARELFLRDDRASLDAADQLLAQIKGQGALVRAARAEIYTVWAQHLRDEAELLQRQAGRMEAAAQLLYRQAAAQAKKSKRRRKGRGEREKVSADPAVLRARGDALRASALELQRDAQQLLHEATEKVNVAGAQLRAAKGAQSERAEVRRSAADLHRLKGEGDVLDLLGQVRRTKPDDAEAHYVEGLFRAARDDTTHAVAALRTSIAEMRAQYKQLLLRSAVALGLIQLRQGQYAEAQKQLEAVLAANADHLWAKQMLEQVQVEMREEASPALVVVADAGAGAGGSSAVASSPRPDARVVRTASATADAASSARRSEVKRGRKPSTARKGGGRLDYLALVKAGNRAIAHGRTMRALDYYERALKLRPKGLEALTGLGYSQLDLQRFTAAMRRFRQAVAQSPGYGDATIGMAEAYLAMGNKSRALDYYKTYLRTHPGGTKAALARRNVKELERLLGTAASPPPGAAPPESATKDEPAKDEASTAPEKAPPAEESTPAPAPVPGASAVKSSEAIIGGEDPTPRVPETPQTDPSSPPTSADAG